MFAGIVEGTVQVTSVLTGAQSLRLILDNPNYFDDLSVGDSVCVDGVCLTLEGQNPGTIEFVAAAETLHITGWNEKSILGKTVNVERSLRWGDRVHGHLVTGHVDALVQVVNIARLGDALTLSLEAPKSLQKYLWKKGSVTLNGVSLTVNEVVGGVFSVCLIPETLRRTNLGNLQIGDWVNLETDYYAKGIIAAHTAEKVAQ